MINPDAYQQQIDFQSELVIDEQVPISAQDQQKSPQGVEIATKIDYTQCDALNGAPKVNDKIAYQVIN